MQKLVINVKTGQAKTVNMTLQEESQRLAEIAKAQQEENDRTTKENQKADALQRLMTSALNNTDLADLLTFLGV